MPSDLNLKKSWNPKLLKNREKVWQKEKEVYDEYKRNQVQSAKSKEINEQEELLALATNSNIPKEKRNTKWMYQSDEGALKALEKDGNDDVMLGNKNVSQSNRSGIQEPKLSGVDQVLKKGLQKREVVKPKPEEVLSKDDPMYAIKLQQMKRKDMIEKRKLVKENESRQSRSIDEYRGVSKNKMSTQDRQYRQTNSRHDSRSNAYNSAGFSRSGPTQRNYRSDDHDNYTRDREPPRNYRSEYRDRR